MGKLVPFTARADVQRAEAVLERLGAAWQRRQQARTLLPRVLAALAEAGQHDFVIQVVLAWGKGEADPAELLEACEAMAALTGVRIE